jgi:quercetin dioxygenase-like cupin family protein
MIMKKHPVHLCVLALVALAPLCLTGKAAAQAGHAADKDHVVITPEAAKWGPAPPALPPGAQLAVLNGNPNSSGALFTIRIKLPDGYKVAPHWHPVDENVTVLKGTLMIGRGEKFDAGASEPVAAGSFMHMPRGMRHFAWAKGETILQLHGIGPFQINYVNPADDPRNK